MSQEGQENQGTGLRDVLDILVKAPLQQLLSLTFQLGESPEDNIVHAMCLIVLEKEERALDKLQMLKNNYLAKHLAETWQRSGGKLADFVIHCGQELTGDSLSALARVFKVLSEQRLCDERLRNLAYKRALYSERTRSCEDLDQLREEAKVVCGPEFAEWMISSKDLKTGSYHDPLSSLDEGNTSLKVTLSQDQPERTHSLPSPLQTTSSMPSYPTHLEISIPATALFQDTKITPESKQNVLALGECEAKSMPGQFNKSQPKPNDPEANKHSKRDESLAAESSKSDSFIAQNETLNQTTKPTTDPNFALPTATNFFLPKMPVPEESQESKDAYEEDEARFYAFVILHAPEDVDAAESMREKLESYVGIDEGATYSGDFEIPGKSTLRSIEDAISNSAFTLLLLTRNFNTRMLEMETDSALINSINKKYKHNTVIPLLPRENCMPKQSLPMVLQTIIPLVEDKSFGRKIQKTLSPAKIKNQRKIWTAQQKVKMQIERQERLKNVNQYHKQLITECTAAELLEKEKISLLMQQKLIITPSAQDGGDGRLQLQQQPNIHIENAQYIMIGNDSQMTVGAGPGTDDSPHKEEEQ
ncbi:TIR domain-containing adapter molecule 1 [Plectropomus leopardus]|uniref:TIR domain-containing adapter molecule 1 n=1 Tax=Plectropomus leopardus TaxID=160734 RepID=UPI001C4CFA74|nr:TIR domain-containing adapter molecule 1 [Plectropomus leopardus]